MILKDLLKEYKFEDIQDRIQSLYPKTTNKTLEKGYKKAFNEMQSIEPIFSRQDIVVKYDMEDRTYDIYAEDGEETFSLMYIDWAEILGMRVDNKSIREFGRTDYLVHVLWEMTYSGYSNKQVQKEGKKLLESCDKKRGKK